MLQGCCGPSPDRSLEREELGRLEPAPKRPQPGKGLALLGAKMGATVPRRVAGGWDGDQEGFGQDVAGSLSLSPMGMGRALFEGG